MHDQAWSAYRVAAGKNSWLAGHLICIHYECSPIVDSYFGKIALRRKGNWIKPVGNQQNVGGDGELRTGHRLRFAPARCIRSAKLHPNAADSGDLAGAVSV